MENQKYLNEENYKKKKNKIIFIALIFLIIGLTASGSLIVVGLKKQETVNSKYSEENKEKISAQIEIEKQNIIIEKEIIEEKIKPIEEQIKELEREDFSGFDDAYYERIDKIEELEQSIATDKATLSVIEGVLENSNFTCSFDGNSNLITSKFCSLTNELEDISSDFNKRFESHNSIPFYMAGAFVLIATIMIFSSIYMFAKRREITAFTTQQILPIAKEGIDEMSPTVGNVAKEIAKGIKDGLSDEENK